MNSPTTAMKSTAERNAQLESTLISGTPAAALEVYADWFEAQGNAVMAALTRLIARGQEKDFAKYVKETLKPTLGALGKKLQPIWQPKLLPKVDSADAALFRGLSIAAPARFEQLTLEPAALHLVHVSRPPKNLEPLAALPRLSMLNLTRAQAADFAPLATLRGLRELDLWASSIADLTPLASLTSLRLLQLYHTPVSELAPLARLRGLQSLSLCEAKRVVDLAPLSALHDLRELNISRTGVTDLRPLSELKQLEYLWAWELTLNDLSPLFGLSSLKRVELIRAKVRPAHITALAQALPHAHIAALS